MKIPDIEGPIRFDEIAIGPAVDAWNNRKESDNAEPFDALAALQWFYEHKDKLIEDLKVILDG